MLALTPEVYSFGVWSQLKPTHIIRDYHSSAVLLPSGRVLVGGGESRHFAAWGDCTNQAGRTPTVSPADYQVFEPPYITCGFTRPVIRYVPQWPTNPNYWIWNYGSQPTITIDSLPLGVSVGKVVLMRPGSVTHHADLNQRCVELAFQMLPPTDPPGPTRGIQVTVPSKTAYLLPRGHYMLFVVTNQGVPSKAAWVQIQ